PKRTRKKAEPAAAEVVVEAPAPVVAADEPAAAEKPKRKSRAKAATADAPAATEAVSDEAPTEDGSPRRGWWQRTFGVEGE
ncbi:MAG: hypothetical protein RLZZ366_409, partial [Pseudomonadota bacterium]